MKTHANLELQFIAKNHYCAGKNLSSGSSLRMQGSVKVGVVVCAG
jgi:hypothetical protein